MCLSFPEYFPTALSLARKSPVVRASSSIFVDVVLDGALGPPVRARDARDRPPPLQRAVGRQHFRVALEVDGRPARGALVTFFVAEEAF